MEFTSFHDILPKIAEKQTRVVTFVNEKNIPDGEYVFMDVHYGSEKKFKFCCGKKQ